MEAPDANGFVNVSWPSKNVPHGGIFHPHIANSSTEQQQFLKVLVEESRLDTKLRHGSVYGLRRDERNSRAAPAGGTPPAASDGASSAAVRPRTSRRRSLSAIRQARLLEEDSYRPVKKGEDREKQIEKLANSMAYGDTPEPVVPSMLSTGQWVKKNGEKKLPTEKQKWNELVTQIRERAEWLAEMEYLGEGGAHREIINEQIAERMRALDVLGIDSQCSTYRSTASGFSTTRSKEKPFIQGPVEKLTSERSNASNKREDIKKRGTKLTGRSRGPVIESVAAYNQLTPLGYSPRRRV